MALALTISRHYRHVAAEKHAIGNDVVPGDSALQNDERGYEAGGEIHPIYVTLQTTISDPVLHHSEYL